MHVGSFFSACCSTCREKWPHMLNYHPINVTFSFLCSCRQTEKLFGCYLFSSHCIFLGGEGQNGPVLSSWQSMENFTFFSFEKEWEEQTLGLWCIVITLGERKVTDKRQTRVWLGMGQRTMSFPWENKMCEMDKACSSNERERQWEGKRERKR